MKHLTVLMTVALLLLTGCGSGAGGYGPVGNVVPYKDSNFSVSAGTYQTATVNMNKGAILEGYITVRGGNDDLRFYIKDSYGSTVLDINRIKGRYDLYYSANNEGFVTIYFDNSFSVFTGKNVYFHYRVR
jgi:hypothetical protein